MAKEREPAWVLSESVEETRTVTLEQVQEALDALQIKAPARSFGTGAEGKLAVALVRHLARQGFSRRTGIPNL